MKPWDGFIGSHISLLLLEKGFVIFIFNLLVHSYDKQIKKVIKMIKDKVKETKKNLSNQRYIEKVLQ